MKNTFYWSNFDANFLNSILSSPKTPIGCRPEFESDEPEELSSFVEAIAPVPDRIFVNKYRTQIEFHCFRNQPDLVLSVFGEKGETNYLSVLNRVSSMTMGEALANRYIEALYRIGCNNEDFTISDFTSPVTWNLKESAPAEFPLYDFQQEAVDKLQDFFMSDKHQSGLLVMPTGSGKTRTAVQFLLRNVIAQGYQVVWLTHRHMLIEQTAEQFKEMSPIIRETNPNAETFRFICVSGMHSTIKAATKKDDLLILSVQTACRNLDYLKKSLKKNVLIVVDEAHHTSAPSYHKIIEAIRKCRTGTKLLGLTATPVRMTDSATEYLLQLFDKNIIFSVSMSSLITKKILSDPHFDRVETEENFEPLISLSEADYIDRYGELPQSVMSKIAVSKRRNAVIVEQYFKHDYGKTLIFALNIVHAKTLTDDLKSRGVKVGCVYSGQGKELNDQIIKQFSDGKLDVLVNVNILSEGSDVPSIETVFLTRPTQSETLLMQMIGRGMRGTSAGGTEKVTIVDFCDKWEVFDRWLTPGNWILQGVDPEEPEGSDLSHPTDKSMIPWSEILRSYRQLKIFSGKFSEHRSIPFGWFSLDDDGEEYTLLVFDGQQHGYIRMIKDRKQLTENAQVTIQELTKQYFGGMCEVPKERDLEVFLRNIKEGLFPHLFYFKERNQIDPFAVATRVLEKGENLFTITEELYQSELAQHFFGSIEEYRDRIFHICNYKASPTNVRIEEMPLEKIPYKLDFPYEIAQLYKEVVDEMFGGSYSGINSVEWTDKPYRTYFGCYYTETADIRINNILNSSGVPREAVKYVIYHELLHRDYYYHDKDFRREEHKYPNYTDWEKVLDVDFGHFEF